MTSIWEKAISILEGNLNSGRIYLTAVILITIFCSIWLRLMQESKLKIRHSSQIKIKLMFSKKATKSNKIFTAILHLLIKCQIYDKDFVNFCGLLRIHEHSPQDLYTMILVRIDSTKEQWQMFGLLTLISKTTMNVCQSVQTSLE